MRKGIIISVFLFTLSVWPILAHALPFSFTATDTPILFGPAPETVSSFITADPLGVITDLDVFVDITHTWTGDLDIFIGHNGQTVQLFNQHGGGGYNITQVLFDDEAFNFIDSGSPPYGPGAFKPTSSPDTGFDNLLSIFDGGQLGGEWELTITDNYYADAGELITFRIEGTATDPIPEPATMILFGTGLAGLVGARFRKKNK